MDINELSAIYPAGCRNVFVNEVTKPVVVQVCESVYL